ncbi:CORIN-like protein [Mya arenaria]|uniref:CORIN-like protein n=1 Tax=Mya arenaria TaxID=6604 RepID=A0ABY7F833_MYAAR|nr:CORIN-like protein [Mya arenaria]
MCFNTHCGFYFNYFLNINAGGYECQNHECLPLSARCDAKQDCADGTDEYKCVQILKNGTTTVFYQDKANAVYERMTICVDRITKVDADILCSLAGQGFIKEITTQKQSISNGLALREDGYKYHDLTLGAVSIDDYQYQVHLGVQSTAEPGDWSQVIPVDRYHDYGYINRPYPNYDMALLHLEHEALITNFTRPEFTASLFQKTKKRNA